MNSKDTHISYAKVPGVYVLTCTATNEKYVGCSGNIHNRLKGHFSLLKHGRHHSPRVQELYDEYGLEGFAWEVLEIIDDKEERFRAERAYIGRGFYSINVVSSPLRENPRKGKCYRTSATYLTPWGNFPSPAKAAEACNNSMSADSIETYCKKSWKTITSRQWNHFRFLQQHDRSIISKRTFADLGFGFEPA